MDRMSVQKLYYILQTHTKLNSVALVRTRTIPTERPPPVGEVSAKHILCKFKFTYFEIK